MKRKSIKNTLSFFIFKTDKYIQFILIIMPIKYVPHKGYQFGDKGKFYPTREEALKQMRAIKVSQGKLIKNKSDKQKRLEKKQEEENKLKKKEDIKNIVENIENLIESYKDNNKLDIKDIINDEEFKDFEVYNMENFDKYKEIFIIGLPGSGKTTISEKISKKYSIPVYHLDDLWKEKYFEGLSDKEADNKLIKFLKSYNKPVIFEGVQPLLSNDYSYFKNKPMLLLKSSIFISSFRAFKRSFHPDYERKFLDLYYILHDNFDFSSKIDTFKKEVGLISA